MTRHPRAGRRPLAAALAALLLLAASATPSAARAEAPARRPSPALVADGDGFSVHKLVSGLSRRDRVVQFAAAVMCLALFILCKKFGEGGRHGG
jgi:hypothetical protein